MKTLIGHSGYVGQSLQAQTHFDFLYRSTNISTAGKQKHELVICSAAPAQKWIANRQPVEDLQNIERLISDLERISCGTFVLVSTVDVFKLPVGVDEDAVVDETGLHPYGLHRRLLEKFVEGHFAKHLIIRLPGLVGPGLRKNVIFDLLNENNLNAVDSRGVFQFYPMVNLWYDIRIALEKGLKLVHLTAEPVSVAEVAMLGFNRPFDRVLPNPPAAYDLRSRHATLFGGTGHYQYSRRESIQAVRAYAQSEQRRTKAPD